MQLSVSQKLGLLGLVGIAGLAAVSGVDHVSGQKVDALQQQVAHSVEGVLLTTILDADLLRVRRVEKDFLLRADESYASQHQDLGKRVEADISRLVAMSEDGSLREVSKDKLSGARSGFDAYKDAFSEVVGTSRLLGLDEKTGLQGSLRASVHEVEARLAQTDEMRLSNLMLMMRLHAAARSKVRAGTQEARVRVRSSHA
jgi:methyl-accepting chemotaxis protein